MPTKIKGVTYYRTHEALQKAGISRATFYRWLAAGRISDSSRRDRNGKRIFTQHEVQEIAEIATHIQNVGRQPRLPLTTRG